MGKPSVLLWSEFKQKCRGAFRLIFAHAICTDSGAFQNALWATRMSNRRFIRSFCLMSSFSSYPLSLFYTLSLSLSLPLFHLLPLLVSPRLAEDSIKCQVIIVSIPLNNRCQGAQGRVAKIKETFEGGGKGAEKHAPPPPLLHSLAQRDFLLSINIP